MDDLIDKALLRTMINLLKKHHYDACYDIFEDIPRNNKNYSHLKYLKDNKLADIASIFQDMQGNWHYGAPMKLTSRGVDHSSSDGGLTAENKIITVRFEPETLKALIEAKIDASNKTTEEKKTLKKRLQSLSGKGVEAVVQNLVHLGIDHVPDIYALLEKVSGL